MWASRLAPLLGALGCLAARSAAAAPVAVTPLRPRASVGARVWSNSGSVVAQVLDAPGQVPDEPEQDIHRSSLDVPSRLPP